MSIVWVSIKQRRYIGQALSCAQIVCRVGQRKLVELYLLVWLIGSGMQLRVCKSRDMQNLSLVYTSRCIEMELYSLAVLLYSLAMNTIKMSPKPTSELHKRALYKAELFPIIAALALTCLPNMQVNFWKASRCVGLLF